MSRQSFSTRDRWSIVVIGGSRDWTDSDMIQEVLNNRYLMFGKDMLVMTGGYRGADRLTRKICEDAGQPYAEVPAWWEALGHSAGPKRNRWILRFQPVEVNLFMIKETPGSMDMKQAADNLGIPVFIHGPPEEELWQRRTESARQRSKREHG